jgi:hypothetical protein
MGTVKEEFDCKVSNITNNYTNESLYNNNDNREELIALEDLAQVSFGGGMFSIQVYIYIYMHIHIYVYIYIYICMHVE